MLLSEFTSILCRSSNVPRAAIYSGPNRRLCLIPTPPTSETAHALASGLWSPLERESRGQAEQRSRSDQHSVRLGSSPLPPTRACFLSIYNGAALSQPLVFPFANVGVRSVRGAALGPLQHRRGVTLGDERPSLLANMKAPTQTPLGPTAS